MKRAGTQMPRGILMGCQRRAHNLESMSIGTVVAVSMFYAAKAFIRTSYIYATEIFRKKEWWEEMVK